MATFSKSIEVFEFKLDDKQKLALKKNEKVFLDHGIEARKGGGTSPINAPSDQDDHEYFGVISIDGVHHVIQDGGLVEIENGKPVATHKPGSFSKSEAAE